jgi:protoporphyrinogen oxidase
MYKIEFIVLEKKKMNIEDGFNMTVSFGTKNVFSFIINKDNIIHDFDELDKEWMRLSSINLTTDDFMIKSNCIDLKTNIFIHFISDSEIKNTSQRILQKVYIVGNRDELYQACGIIINSE